MAAEQLIILGSGTAVPSPRRGAPGCLLALGASRVLLDSGPGTIDRLLRSGTRPDEVTHIAYSHNHLDHTGELAPWLFASRIPSAPRTAPLTLCGSPGFMSMLASLRGLYGHWLDAPTYPLILVTLEAKRADSIDLGGWEVQACPVSHIESSLGYRFTLPSGKVLAWTGDTGFCEELIELAKDADLLLIEASTPDGRGLEGHLTPSLAGEVARRAGARRVVLTHMNPECDDVDMLAQLRGAWPGEAILAQDGLRVPL